MSGNGEVCEKLRKIMIDVCCIQVRWRGQSVNMLGIME